MKIEYIFIFYLFLAKSVFALSPQNIVIVYNRNMAQSKDVAIYYAAKRKVPISNLVEVNVVPSESISRFEFENRIVPKIRSKVFELKKNNIKPVILLIYGIPLLVENAKGMNPDKETSASVDSELTMIFSVHYRLSKWLINPFLKKYDKLSSMVQIRKRTVMVGRLDGPTAKLSKSLVDTAISVEKKGLKGIFYIDARGLRGNDAYSKYDQHLRNLYKLIKEKSSMKVVLNDNHGLFGKHSCSNAALYCGWYSLGKYVDSFQWNKGAVGFHVASSEAATLKKKSSQVWCKRMLEEGVAATLGPVAEPFLSSFPLPGVFFPLLMTGKLTLLEVYFRSIPFLSWRQIIIGDPLYTPFKNNPVFRAWF